MKKTTLCLYHETNAKDKTCNWAYKLSAAVAPTPLSVEMGQVLDRYYPPSIIYLATVEVVERGPGHVGPMGIAVGHRMTDIDGNEWVVESIRFQPSDVDNYKQFPIIK